MTRPSEDDLIARYFAPIAGPGALELKDDAALITPPPGHDLVITTDALVAGGHFFVDDPPRAISRKALRVNLSDLAAKGAAPLGILLALALPPDWTPDWLAEFAAGLGEDAAAYRCPLLGGDTVKTPGPLTISITALGCVPNGAMVRRTGVRPGDHLFVTGTIGDAALGLRLRLAAAEDAAWRAALSEHARKFLELRYLLPQPRLALAPVLRAFAHGAMDVSDGLIGDLTKMLRVSGVGAAVDLSRVPLSSAARAAVAARADLFEAALTGGDDYEIICAVPPEFSARFASGAAAAGVVAARIGEALPLAAGVTFIGRDGAPKNFERGSFSHF